MKKTILLSVLYIGFVVLSLEFITKPAPVNELQRPTMVTTHNESPNLLDEIRTYANKNNTEPIDARLDRIWKAIPGYNGLTIDVEESYLAMWTNNEFDAEKLVYNEVPPKVHLTDLPPSPIYRGNPEKPMVTLLINVAWGNEFIPQILKTLDEHKVKATFFFDGSWVKKNPDLAKKIFNENHEIGNHAYSHPDLKHKSPKETEIELSKTNDVIKETLGIKPKWFAPPSGSFKQETITVARKLDMLTILWTADTVDWRNPSTSEMVKRVTSQVENGTMILMHPTRPTAEGLDSMIRDIKEKGYVLGTVSEMMSEERIAPQ
nr:polysaccharide deacetylase family protein [Sporosarcina jiandibaonis]